ncbi:MAG: group III truncated hemoglobin, partial [Flavobacteriales bacterium]
PTMYAFWNKILLGTGSYTGSPFDKHISLPIEQKHFDRWIDLFQKNMDTLFQGELAEEAKLRARSIGGIFAAKHKFLKEQKEQS